MNERYLVLEIVTPDEKSMKEKRVDVIVCRRREKHFERGSEIALFPRHAPELIRIPIAPLRYRKGEQTWYVAVGGGFVEIKEDQVLVVTPRFEKIPFGEPAPSIKARHITDQWRQEQREFQKEMVGYL